MIQNEPQQIALRYKGEDYGECKQQLAADGFRHEGFNQWRSPETDTLYRFVLAEEGGYVTRVELVDSDGPRMIPTEFCDRDEALARYDAEHARPTRDTLATCVNAFLDEHLRTSMSKVIRMIEKGRAEGDHHSEYLFRYICTPGKDKLVIKNYLFCDGIVCFYSPTRRTTHQLVRIIEHGGKKHYLYRARYYLEDLLESLVSKVKLCHVLGEDVVASISEAAG